MKKTTKKKTGMPSLREAFVIKEKEYCGSDKDLDEAGPPPIPGTAPGKPPPIPSQAQQQQRTQPSATRQAMGITQYVQGVMSDIMSLEKDLQINRSKYAGLEITSEINALQKAAQNLKTKVDNWNGEQQKAQTVRGVAPTAFGGTA